MQKGLLDQRSDRALMGCRFETIRFYHLMNVTIRSPRFVLRQYVITARASCTLKEAKEYESLTAAS